MNTKQEVPKTPDQATSNINSYFTKDIHGQITGMGLKEMESLMKEMIDTRQWIALLKYTSMRTPLLDATLRGTNPIVEPHKISWAQGCLAGLCDIETYVIDLNAPKPKTETKEEVESDILDEGRPEGTLFGN